MENGAGVAVIIFLLLCFGSYFWGRMDVHQDWRADAIERCSKVQPKEWCQGRAVLERW
jgi:hypothetical protein